jgi:hypothetical protein
MGTWGVGAWENDEALDWSLEFEDADLEAGLNLIRAALNFEVADTEGIPEPDLTENLAFLRDLTEMRAVAAAELVIRINGHPVPDAPDTHGMNEWVTVENAEPVSHEEIEASKEEMLGELHKELSGFYSAVAGRKVELPPVETETWTAGDDEDDDDEEYVEQALLWIERTRPASDSDLTELARRAIAQVTADSDLGKGWDEDRSGAVWRSYMAEMAAKLAEEPVRPS